MTAARDDPASRRWIVLALIMTAQTVACIGPLGMSLAISSVGVTLGPPVFGYFAEWAGGCRGPWIGLALAMAGGLGLLAPVRERSRFE